MGWIENRLQALESRFEALLRQVQDLVVDVRAAAQAARNAYQQWQPGGAGTAGVFTCMPTTMGGATGTFPSLTPGSQSLTVYQVTGTSIASVGTFTVYNWLPAAPAASKVAYCIPDGGGNYVLISQSCT